MQTSINEYFLLRDSNYKLALRNLLRRFFDETQRLDLVTYKISESRSPILKVPRYFHYPFLKRNNFTLHRSIILSDNQREEIWYKNGESIFYCKTGEVYEFCGVRESDLHHYNSILKRAITNEIMITEAKARLAEKYYKNFLRMVKQILEYAPPVTKTDSFSLNYIINESHLVGEQSCKYTAALAYTMLLENKYFDVCIGSLTKNPDLYDPKNSHCLYIESGNTQYFHNATLKNYYGAIKKASNFDIVKSFDVREGFILNEMKRLEFLKKSEHDPRTKRRIKYLKRKYNIVNVDERKMKKYGHFRVTVEVGNYEIIVMIDSFIKSLRVLTNLLGKDAKLNYDLLRSALPKLVDSSDLKIHCSCPDFKYRFAYWATKHKYKEGMKERRPAKIRNPKDSLGSACKHVLALFSNKEWVRNAAPYIRKIIQEHPELISK